MLRPSVSVMGVLKRRGESEGDGSFFFFVPLPRKSQICKFVCPDNMGRKEGE